MEKVCKRCGKIAQMMSWEDYCYACLIQNELERVQLNVREAKEDEDPDTYSTDYVICPYCGCELPTDLSYEDFPEIYEEGDHKLTCPECDKDFRLTTSVSYSWETERIKDNEQDSNK